MRPFVSPTTRGRLVGAAILLIVFAAGLAAGAAWTRARSTGREGRAGVNVNVRMTTELPRELRRLNLTSLQEDSLRALLIAGQRRMRRVLSEFDPRLRALIDSVDADIRAVLTPQQRERFDATRRAARRDEVSIDTVRR